VIGLTLGRIFGTEVRAHWTWIPISAFIAVMFGVDLSDGTAAHWPIALAWGASIASAILAFASVTGHELAHVRMARRSGQIIPTVTVQLLGGQYMMEVKPKDAGEELRIALAGPAFSFLVAVVFGVVGGALVVGPFDKAPDWLAAIAFVVTMIAAFNLLLCAMNMLPGYPMDGARILHAVVWRRTGQDSVATAATIRVGRNVGTALVVAGALAMTFFDLMVGLSLVAIGWLVISSSRFLDRRTVLQELIAGLHVCDAEDLDVARVPPQLTLDAFASEFLGERLGGVALVERGDELVGMIGTAQIKRVPARAWPRTRTEAVMVRIDAVPRVDADLDLWSALEVLERTGLDALIVTTGAGVATAAPSEAADAPEAANPAPSDAASAAPSQVAYADDATIAAGPANTDDSTERRDPTLLTRRAAAKLVHQKAEDRHRQIVALSLINKGRFRGR
jgi:Zn-dependent protease/CBS domain-containing protein